MLVHRTRPQVSQCIYQWIHWIHDMRNRLLEHCSVTTEFNGVLLGSCCTPVCNAPVSKVGTAKTAKTANWLGDGVLFW